MIVSNMPIATFEDVTNLQVSATPEGLHLEYKLKQESSTPELSKDDRRSIAEAIVSFANSDGGTLIYGVGSEKCDGLDVAGSLVPIAEVDKFVGRMRLVAELNISPQVSGITFHSIYLDDESRAGFAVCHIPTSDRRPHMSTAPGVHRYYRRSFTGSSIMTPSEIRDQILAVREAILKPIVEIGGGGASFSHQDSWLAIQTGFSIMLRNVGSRLCREPFMRVTATCELQSYSVGFASRLGAWKTEYPPGTIIHVDDYSSPVSFQFLARLSKIAFRNPETLTLDAMLESVTIYPGTDQHSDAAFTGQGLDSIAVTVAFGAENTTMQSETFSFSRAELAQKVLAASAQTLRHMLKGEAGLWRQDLIDQLQL